MWGRIWAGLAEVSVRAAATTERSKNLVTKFRTLDDIDVCGKRALLRADLNVPMKTAL